MIHQERYKQNLHVDGDSIYSYDTNVARISHFAHVVYVPRWYSATTSKHINYIAGLYGYKVIKQYAT